MGEVSLKVELIGKTYLSNKFYFKIAEEIEDPGLMELIDDNGTKALALTAIRTCYSSNRPTEIVAKEAERYFKQDATDDGGGREADRLIRQIVRSKHTSTLEHLSYTFAIEGLSRAALAQLTRHRHFSFSVQSQRYVKFGSGDRLGGFDYVVPWSLDEHDEKVFREQMERIQETYDALREAGVPAEDARFVLPNAAATNLVLTGNLRAILEFYSKRQAGRGAQWEVAHLAECIRCAIIEEDPWVNELFEMV